MELPRARRRNPALSPLSSAHSGSSSVISSPSDASTASMASSTASLLSVELDDWLPPLNLNSSHKDAAKSPLWPPVHHDANHDMVLADELLLSEMGGGGGSVAWLGDGLHYEPESEDPAPLPVDTTHPTEKTIGGGCGMAGKCGGGAQFADMEALAAAGGCCRGEAGAASCCRVATSSTETMKENAATQSVLMAVQVSPSTPFQGPNTVITSQNTPSPLACGCSDGNCSSSSSDGNAMLKAKSIEGDGGSSDSTVSSSSSSGVKHRRSTINKATTSVTGTDKLGAPRTRKRRSHLTPEERATVRREQHRETMRRSRQRFRDRIDAMKETVERLETVKANALAALELSASVSESGLITNGVTEDDAVLRDQLAFLEREEQQLVREKRELHAQVVQSLLEIVASHPSNFRAVTNANRELVMLRNDAAHAGEFSSTASITSDGLTLCDFVTWDVATIGHCLALVRDSYAEISHFYASINSQGGLPTSGYDAFAHANGNYHQHPGSYSTSLFRSGLELMGWHDHRRFRGDGSNDTCLEFAFEKVVPAADARELFIKTWLFCRDQQSFASMFAPAVAALELEVLHEIHDDLVVVRRMQQEEEEDQQGETATKKTTKFRSIDLLYRIDVMDEGDDDGWSYVVFRSINPSFVQSCGCAGNAWFDAYMWFGFAPARSGVGGSRVRFGGTLDGHSRAFAMRWMIAIFFVLLRWESANVAPLLIVP